MVAGGVRRLLLFATLVASGSMQAAREKCMITFLDGCRLHRAYEGVADDSATAYDHMGVGESEERCLVRAKEYFEWCANGFHQQVCQCIWLLYDFLFV
jgi:hypothetical protein